MLSIISVEFNDQVRKFALPPEAGNKESRDFKRLVCLEFDIDPNSDVALISPKTTKGIDGSVVIPINLGLLHQVELLSTSSGRYTLKAYEVIKQKKIEKGKELKFKGEDQSQRKQHIEVKAKMKQKSQTTSTELPYNTVLTLYAYTAQSITELTFKKDDHIVVEGQWDANWWKGSIGEQSGYFPAAYVKGLEAIEFEKEVEDEKEDFQDDAYFDSYSTVVIHHQMLSDTVRTNAYQNAITSLVKHIKGKIVLDVGCGSGILSIFCAKAGAKHVYAIDASDIIRTVAKKVIQRNNLQDTITTIQGKIEEIELPVKNVDVIISEWMGTFLICESMISSTLFARKKFLKPSGTMMPSLAEMYLCPVCVDEFYDGRIKYWKEVYGVGMECVIPLAKGHFFDKPIYDRPIKPSELMADPCAVISIDMQTWLERDLENMSQAFSFTIKKGGNMHGFGAWFDTWFEDSLSTPQKKKADQDVWKTGAWREEKPPAGFPIILTTSPHHKITHWNHVLIIFHDPIVVAEGQVVSGVSTVTRHKKWRRHFDFHVHFKVFKTKSPSSASPSTTTTTTAAAEAVASSSSTTTTTATSDSPPSMNGKVLETDDFVEYDYNYNMWHS